MRMSIPQGRELQHQHRLDAGAPQHVDQPEGKLGSVDEDEALIR